MVKASDKQEVQVMGVFIYDTKGMLLFSGLEKAAAVAYAELFGLTDFTLVVRESTMQRRSSER